MKKIILLAATAALVCSCYEDPLYTADSVRDTDTEMSFFQNGLSIPIGSSVPFRVDSLIRITGLDSLVGDFLKMNPVDSTYYIEVAGTVDLDSTIKALGIDSLVSLDAVEVEKKFKRSTGSFDASALSTQAQSFGNPVKLGDFMSLMNFSIPKVDMKVLDTKAGFTGKNLNFTVEMSPVSQSRTLAQKSTLQQLAQAAAFLGNADNIEIPGMDDLAIEKITKQIDGSTLPSGIKSVKDVELSEGAGVKFEISVQNGSVLKSGTIIPNITADLSKALTFKGFGGVINLSELQLNAQNGYSMSKTYFIDKVIVEGIDKPRDITLQGSVKVQDATTSAELASAAQGDVVLNISVSFVNMQIKDAVCELETVSFEKDVETSLQLPTIELPSQVKEVRSLTFSDNSDLVVNIVPSNLSQMPGVTVTMDELTVNFPEGYEISGTDVQNNVLSVRNKPMTAPLSTTISFDKLNLPSPTAEGKIKIAGNITAHVKASASGTVRMSEIPRNAANDIAISATVAGDLAMADFDLTTARIEQDLSVAAQRISIEVPGDLGASFGQFRVLPEGNPEMTLKMKVPDLGAFSINAGDGIVITLPSLLEFGSVDPALNFNEEKHTITLNSIETRTYQLPVKALNIVPFKRDDKYVIEGEYGIEGKIVAEETVLDMTGLDKISGAEFDFGVEIPALKAKSVELESLEINLSESMKQNLVAARDIPEMVKKVGAINLDGVSAKIDIFVEGLPDIGNGKFLVDLSATLPDYIKPSTVALNGEIKNNEHFTTQIPVQGIDLSQFDFAKMRENADSIGAEINLVGKISAVNPTVDINNLSANVSATMSLKLSDETGHIGINDATAYIDLGIDTLIHTAFISDLTKDIEARGFGLPVVTCELDMETNIGLPVYLSAEVTPFNSNGWYFDEASLSINKDGKFDSPYSTDPDVLDKTHNTVTLDIEKFVTTLADSLEIAVTAGIDPDRMCYLKPESDYKLHLAYDVTAPVMLGSALDITLPSVELPLDSTVTMLMQNVAFGLNLQIDNHLPFGVGISVDFLDGLGKAVACNSEGSLNPSIEPDKIQNLELVFNADENADMTEVKSVRIGFCLSSAGRALRPGDYLQLKSAAVMLPEGVTITNELLNEITNI